MEDEHQDTYENFEQLKAVEREDVDFSIRCTPRNLPVAIIAPHGGKIEPGTSEIASAIAGADYSLYRFEGLKANHNFKLLHIKSGNFNEPKCVALVQASDYVVAVHGLRGANKAIDVGGLDEKLRDSIRANLEAAGFTAKVVTSGKHAAREADNICNRGRRKMGVQLEITNGLRKVLNTDRERLSAFAFAVREAILDQIGD
jgi:phage replication-related protein YjqB (UPF0714/DUF867 family)